MLKRSQIKALGGQMRKKTLEANEGRDHVERERQVGQVYLSKQVLI